MLCIEGRYQKQCKPKVSYRRFVEEKLQMEGMEIAQQKPKY